MDDIRTKIVEVILVLITLMGMVIIFHSELIHWVYRIIT